MKQIKDPTDRDLREAWAGVKLAWFKSAKYYFSMIDGVHYLNIEPMEDIDKAPEDLLNWWGRIK